MIALDTEVLNSIILATGLMGAGALAIGQFKVGRVKTLKADLIETNSRADRLEKHVEEMQRSLARLEAENEVLKATLSTGAQLAPQIEELIKREFDSFSEKVRVRHELLAKQLPPLIGEPLRNVVSEPIVTPK